MTLFGSDSTIDTMIEGVLYVGVMFVVAGVNVDATSSMKGLGGAFQSIHEQFHFLNNVMGVSAQ